MVSEEKPILQVTGFSISSGTIKGVLKFLDSPYLEIMNISNKTILVLKYPASTFMKAMFKAGGVIAEQGTSKIDSAKFMNKSGKPVFYGAGNLSTYIADGDNIKLLVTPQNTAFIYGA